MEQEVLETADAVIDALGGTTEASKITGQSAQTVSNWRAGGRNRIPPEYFLTISRALADGGKAAAPEVFGMKTTEVPAQEQAEPAA